MPISKCLQKSEPLWKGWDRKAQKNGLRHQVYAVSGDCYVGEWKDNMKHASGLPCLQCRPIRVSSGKGTQIWKKKGAIYEGDWKFGKRDGYGTLSFPDQEMGKPRKVYSGWWKDDKKSNRPSVGPAQERGRKSGSKEAEATPLAIGQERKVLEVEASQNREMPEPSPYLQNVAYGASTNSQRLWDSVFRTQGVLRG
ncbi:MORN repeat-containing protein 3 isoform X10 [Callorhinus ursinus]|uniref:MORN repeat-containing protein 3 isoform X10 n=1 Tax=Callorhinus ursinus TaxID=34884 RepID=UPI003CD035EF